MPAVPADSAFSAAQAVVRRLRDRSDRRDMDKCKCVRGAHVDRQLSWSCALSHAQRGRDTGRRAGSRVRPDFTSRNRSRNRSEPGPYAGRFLARLHGPGERL
eukprot:8630205-Alexandrium_andersonii.AAC.1